MKKWLVTLQERNEGEDLKIMVTAVDENEAKSRVSSLLDSGYYYFKRIEEITP